MAYSNYDQNCGYVQGMNSIAGSILEHYNKINEKESYGDFIEKLKKNGKQNEKIIQRLDTSEKSAFWLYVTIMSNYGLRKVYSRDFLDLQTIIQNFEDRLTEKCPRVKTHLDEIGVNCFSIFLASYMTLLMHHCSFETSVKIVDMF